MRRILAALAIFAFVLAYWTHPRNEWIAHAAPPPPQPESLPGCVYNSSSFTMATGQRVTLQCDINGKLITSSTGGGGGGAVTIANGADVALGSTTDAPCTFPTTTTAQTLDALAKCLVNLAATAPLPYPFTPLTPGQHGTAITSSTALTIPATATYATMCARTAAINYTTDGTTTPTSTVGQPLAAGACVALSGPTVLANLKMISATGTPDVEYFK